jgi:predicted nuclease with RNAse H fold
VTLSVPSSVGIDVGARRLHAVALDGGAAILGVAVFDSADVDELVGWASGAENVAIDSPDRWSTGPHSSEPELSPKFRTARCAEIALGRKHRIWVPWTTPMEPVPGWIRVGIDLFTALRAKGQEPVEVFPYAIFRVLAGGRRLPPKRTSAGARLRLELLEQAGVSGARLDRWSHDALDAAAAAVVALHRGLGTARPVTCGHDGSAIWLPAG